MLGFSSYKTQKLQLHSIQNQNETESYAFIITKWSDSQIATYKAMHPLYLGDINETQLNSKNSVF